MSRLWTPAEIRSLAGREIDRRNRIGTVFQREHLSAPIRPDQFRFINSIGETIPHGAVLQPTEVVDVTEEGDATIWVMDVRQPNSTGSAVHFINSGPDIEYNGGGICETPDKPIKVMIDPAASPSFLSRCAPAAGQWYLTTDATGDFFYLGLNDGTLGLFQQGTPTDSLVIGVTLGSTAATTATVNSRPPSWDTVPGETAGIVSITNPSSLAISSTGLSFHATYAERNSTSQWELIGGAGGGAAQEPAYASLVANSTTVTGASTYTKISYRLPEVTAYGITASTANYDLTIETAGVYHVSCYAGGLTADSLPSTNFTAFFELFKNSSFSNFACAVDIGAINSTVHNHAMGLSGVTHLRSSDVIDMRVYVPTGSVLAISRGHLSAHLVRATTST